MATHGARAARPDAVRARARETLNQLRGRIDELDGRILALLGERYQVIEEVQRVKQDSGDGVYAPARERAQLARLERLNRELPRPLRPEWVRSIFGEILSASRALQAPLTVAYLGPAGTYSEHAAVAQFGSSAKLVPVASIPEVFRAVEREQARLGIVPIENSTDGMVGATLDALATTPLRIVAEREMPIRHALLSRSSRLSDVKRVFSHPQSLGQCRDWLARHLPDVPTVEMASNAAAAEAAARRAGAAAIASRETAERYRLRVLADSIQDLARNVTRFVVLAPPAEGHEPGADKVSVLFSVRNEPGRLFEALKPLAQNEIDLCKLESRPMRGRPWEYLFFVDFRGEIDSPRVKRAMAAMERDCLWFKVLGTYAEAIGA
ncbi:MAG TPA: prephenate dehydratase [Candidatus Binatia bacterium]|nr:prephenate dehydratase [Candidatus Binatia bacterium]